MKLFKGQAAVASMQEVSASLSNGRPFCGAHGQGTVPFNRLRVLEPVEGGGQRATSPAECKRCHEVMSQPGFTGQVGARVASFWSVFKPGFAGNRWRDGLRTVRADAPAAVRADTPAAVRACGLAVARGRCGDRPSINRAGPGCNAMSKRGGQPAHISTRMQAVIQLTPKGLNDRAGYTAG